MSRRRGYDNDFNYQAPEFHLAVILGFLIPLAVYLLLYSITAVRLLRWNREIKDRMANESEDELENLAISRVPVPEPLLVPESGLEPPPGTDTVSTSSRAENSSPTISTEEREEIAEPTGPGDHEEVPEASLVRGRFVPSEEFVRVLSRVPGLIDEIPGHRCPVYAVCGWMAPPQSRYFMGLHFSREPSHPGETWYSASAHLMLRAVEIDEDLRVPDLHEGTIFSLRFREDGGNNPSAGDVFHEPRVQYTLEPDSGNLSLPFHTGSHRKSINLPGGSAVKFRLMFWGPPRATEAIHPANSHQEPQHGGNRTRPADMFVGLPEEYEAAADGISYYPIEIGTITLDTHWAFYYKKAPRPGERFFNYNKLMRNLQSGEKHPMLGVGLRWGNYGGEMMHTSP